MSWNLVAKTSKQSSDGNSVTTDAIDTTGATLLIVLLSAEPDSSFGTFGDSKGNTWTEGSFANAGSALRDIVYYCEPTSVGSGHTFHLTLGSTCRPSLAVLAYTGNRTSPADQSNAVGTNNNVIAPGSITPTENGELVVCGISSLADAGSIDSGFTYQESAGNTANAEGFAIATKIQTTAAAVNPTTTFGSTTSHVAAMISFMVPAVSLPDAPTALSVTNVTTTIADISFDDGGQVGLTGYTFQYDFDNTFPSPVSIAIAPSDTTIAFPSALAHGTQYFARIRATNVTGNSSWSSTASFVAVQEAEGLSGPVVSTTLSTLLGSQRTYPELFLWQGPDSQTYAPATFVNAYPPYWVNTLGDPTVSANAAAAVLLTRLPQHRFLISPLATTSLTDYAKSVASLTDYLANGIDVDADRSLWNGGPRLASQYPVGIDGATALVSARSWWTTFWERLNTLSCPVRAVFLDDESSVNTFLMTGLMSSEDFATVYNDEDVQAARPDYVEEFDASDIYDFVNYAPGIIAFNKWVDSIKKDSEFSAVAETYSDTFGSPLILSDFDDTTSDLALDPNGWPTQGTAASIASPQIYIDWRVWDTYSVEEYQGFTKDTDYYWQQFVRSRNNLNACIAADADDVIPWVPFASWSDYSPPAPAPIQFLQGRIIRHALQLGISKFVFWNPHEDVNGIVGNGCKLEDDLKMKDWTQWPIAVSLTSNSLADPAAASVTDGSVTTTFAEYHALWDDVE